MTASVDSLRVKIFADGADRASVEQRCREPWIRGFTTNPTLMRAAGVDDYESFARELLELVPDLPISFEVIADDLDEIERQARLIADWGENVYVKVPDHERRDASRWSASSGGLPADGIKVNVTAVMTVPQVEDAASWLADGPAGYVSVFAGTHRGLGTRSDTDHGLGARGLGAVSAPGADLGEPARVLNVVQADAIGCHVITVTDGILARLPGLGRDLDEFSLDTVKMFHRDGEAAGYALEATTLGARPRSAQRTSRISRMSWTGPVKR